MARNEVMGEFSIPPSPYLTLRTTGETGRWTTAEVA